MRVRILDGDVPFYDTADATEPTGHLSGQPVVEIAGAQDGQNRLQMMLPDGRRKFVAKEVKVLQMPLWTVASNHVKVFTQPDAFSPVIATLSYGAMIEQSGLKMQLNGQDWIPVGLRDGRWGYVEAKLKVVSHGSQLRIEDGSGSQGTQWLLKDKKLRPFAKRLKTPREAAVRNMVLGGVWCGVGLTVTFVTLSAAMDSGGYYLVFWGPVVYGGIRIVRGAYGYLKSL